MVQVFYSPAFVTAGHSFDTTRKAKWVADSLAVAPITGIELVEPEPLTGPQVAAVHDPIYVRAVETGEPRRLAESQGFRWDQGLWSAVLASNGGAVAAALAAMRDGVAGSLSSGLHHARYGRGGGFCTFNGLAIAARRALAAGAGSVLILDLDAHGGGGTASLVSGEPRIWQLDVAVNPFDGYQSTERLWRAEPTADEYLTTIREGLTELERLGPAFDLCLYNAGMDPHEAAGGVDGITAAVLAEREQMVFEWCRRRRLPVAFVLAGGYVGPRLDQDGVAALHRLTLSAAAAVSSSTFATEGPLQPLPTVRTPPASPNTDDLIRELGLPTRHQDAPPIVVVPTEAFGEPTTDWIWEGLDAAPRWVQSVIAPEVPHRASGDEAAFLNELRFKPKDETTRLVYADWLEERSDPVSVAKAEFLRLRHQYTRITSRLNDLAAQLDPAWLSTIGEPPPPVDIELRSGRRVELIALQQWYTYQYLVEGVPISDENRRDIQRIVAGLETHGTRVVVVPARERPEPDRPGGYSREAPERWLPSVACVGRFRSGPVPGGIEPLSSDLYVVWFQYRLATPIDPGVREQIRMLDWDAVATNEEM